MKRGRFSDEQIVRILPFQFRTLSLATGCGVLHPLQYLLFLPIFVILPGALGRPILAGYSLSKNPGVPIHLRRGNQIEDAVVQAKKDFAQQIAVASGME